MPVINDPIVRGWIIRLFREGRADLSASYDIEEPFISANIIIQSMKKLQKAIFFCLGDPESIQELVLYNMDSTNPLYELLSTLQKIIEYWIQNVLSFKDINITEILLDAKIFFTFTKIFITNFIEDKIPPKFNIFPEKF
ncbi:MAG: hypothetical protein ACFFD2_14085 [Promethearchaeota archaeon]